MSVFAGPRIGEDHVKLIGIGAPQPFAAVRVNKRDSKIIAETLFRDFKYSFVYFDGNQPRLRVHSIEHPHRRHTCSCAEFEKIARGFRRRKRAQQAAREQVGSHREIETGRLRKNMRQQRGQVEIFSLAHFPLIEFPRASAYILVTGVSVVPLFYLSSIFSRRSETTSFCGTLTWMDSNMFLTKTQPSSCSVSSTIIT